MAEPAPRRRSAWTRRAGKGLLAAGSIAVALLACEGFLRVGGHLVLREAEFLAVGDIFETPSPPLGFRLIPGSSRIVARGGAFVSRESISSQGFRDIEHPVGRQPGRFRILVLGDSFMFGDGVAMSETMPRRLGHLMPQAEVINAGVRAYDLGQEYLLYLHEARRFRPDLVLVGFFINDLTPDPTMRAIDGPDGLPVAYEPTPEVMQRRRADLRPGWTGAASRWLRQRSMLYVLGRQRIDRLLAPRPGASPAPRDNAAGIFYLPAFQPEGEGVRLWDRAHRILDALAADVARDGARLGIVVIPAPWQLSEAMWSDWVAWLGVAQGSISRLLPQQRMRAWCDRSATACLDLLEELDAGQRQRLYFRGDHHWTAEGHEVAALAVRRFLDERRLLEPPPHLTGLRGLTRRGSLPPTARRLQRGLSEWGMTLRGGGPSAGRGAARSSGPAQGQVPAVEWAVIAGQTAVAPE